jgi:hypothetical protein
MLRPAGRELNGDPDDEQVIDVMMVTTGWIEEANACKTLQQRRACVRTGRAGRGSGAAPARSWIFSIVRQRARRTRTCQDRRRIQIHQTTRSPVTTTGTGCPGVSIDARGLARYWAYLSQLDAAGQGHELLVHART